MFEFKGAISKECKKNVLLREAKKYVFIMTIAALSVLCPVISICIFLFDFPPIPIILGSCFIFTTIVIAVFFSSFSEETQKDCIPLRVVVLDDGTIIQYTQRSEHVSSLSKIKKILDYGTWFVLICPSSTGLGSKQFVIQKNLLIQGSLEDFENLLKSGM